MSADGASSDVAAGHRAAAAATLASGFVGVGTATMASRVLGFVRDTLIAASLGTGPVADAFVVAFRLPNLFRRLFAEGAFNSAFVPLYARALETEGEAAAARFAGEALAGLLAMLLVVSAVAMIGAPLLVLMLAPGFAADGAKFELTTLLTRICFPYLACMSVIALLSGVLNAHRRFLAAAAAPILLNVVLILVLAAIVGFGLAHTVEAGIALAGGVALAGVVQLAMVALAVRRGGWSVPLQRPRWSRSMGRLVALGVPGLVAGGITQINIVVGTVIASLSAGSVSFLYYADRVYQLPLGIVGVAIGVVLLPEIARQVRAGRDDVALHAQNRSFEFGCVLTLPAAAALAIAAGPIIEVLFERGAFGPQDTMKTAEALAAFALGLPAFVFVKVFSPAFFAREDTATPMWIAAVAVVVNIAVAVALLPTLAHVAVALATSVAGWVNAGLLWIVLVRRGHWRVDGELETRLPRLVAATLGMALPLWLLVDPLAAWTGAENALPVKLAALALLVVVGMATFFGLAQGLGGIDLRRAASLFRRKRGATD